MLTPIAPASVSIQAIACAWALPSRTRGRPCARVWQKLPSAVPAAFRTADPNRVDPVMFPPGRARLVTNPLATGSPSCIITIGVVTLASLAARVADEPAVTMTSTLKRISSAASAGKRSSRPSADRHSMTTFSPSMYPSPGANPAGMLGCAAQEWQEGRPRGIRSGEFSQAAAPESAAARSAPRCRAGRWHHAASFDHSGTSLPVAGLILPLSLIRQWMSLAIDHLAGRHLDPPSLVQYSTSRLLSFRGMPISCFSTATTYMVRAARIDDAGHRILRLHARNGRRQRVAAHGRTRPDHRRSQIDP